ncbi:hypothetical protein BRO54_1853 [Geobacillus proteiniphilus]|uniref:Uncharacterized protein n=1 Tax=Geobacillus proteiniphilus TaxID=860353 RepID=A0A1Q5SZU7_9BACL|nr:hypothetical protein BRO54_1853 [Geobacillus proteiniphilus]
MILVFFISKLTVLSLAVLLLVLITVVWIRRGIGSRDERQ